MIFGLQMYKKLVILSPFLFPHTKNEGRKEGEKCNKTGFNFFFVDQNFFIELNTFHFPLQIVYYSVDFSGNRIDSCAVNSQRFLVYKGYLL